MKKEKKHIIPVWLYYTFLVIFILGITQIMVGNLSWGVTLEKNTTIIITYFSLIVILSDQIGVWIKHKYKIKIVD